MTHSWPHGSYHSRFPNKHLETMYQRLRWKRFPMSEVVNYLYEYLHETDIYGPRLELCSSPELQSVPFAQVTHPTRPQWNFVVRFPPQISQGLFGRIRLSQAPTGNELLALKLADIVNFVETRHGYEMKTLLDYFKACQSYQCIVYVQVPRSSDIAPSIILEFPSHPILNSITPITSKFLLDMLDYSMARRLGA